MCLAFTSQQGAILLLAHHTDIETIITLRQQRWGGGTNKSLFYERHHKFALTCHSQEGGLK